MNDQIIIRGAREHNLRNVSLTVPRDKLVYGAVRVGQKLAGVRYHLCRGTAALCGKPVQLCAAVSGANGEARC